MGHECSFWYIIGAYLALLSSLWWWAMTGRWEL